MENESLSSEQSEPVSEQAPAQPGGFNLPVIITLAALLIWFGFQTLQLFRERANLGFVKANQDSALQESEKIRVQFQSIMTKTSELASQGHPGARLVIEELQRRGIGVPSEARPADKIESKPAK